MKKIGRTSGKSFVYSFKLLWKYKKVLLFLYLLRTVIQVGNAYSLVYLPSAIISSLNDKSYNITIIIIVVFIALQFFLSVITSIIQRSIVISEKEYDEQVDILQYEKVMSLCYEQLVSSDIRNQYELSRTCREKGSIQGMISSAFSIVSSIIVIISAVIALKNIPWFICLTVCLLSMLSGILKYRIVKADYKRTEEKTIAERKLAYFRDGLTWQRYAKEIRSYSLNDFIKTKLYESINDVYYINKRFNRDNTKKSSLINAINIPQDALIYVFNLYLILRSFISVGQFTLNVSALQQAVGGMYNIVSQVVSIAEQMTYLDSFVGFLELESKCNGTEDLPSGSGTIEFINVSFSYPGQTKFVIQNLNLKINKGEKISIVGKNGAGKTTFVNLLMGLYIPTNGQILYNGIDINRIKSNEYSKLFSPIMQDYNIYCFRIIDNLTFKSSLDDREYTEACRVIKKAGLKKTVDSLPGGIETFVSQLFSSDGIELSEGQKQKIALARCLYRNSPIMILDEPTSALSPQSEYELYNSFKSFSLDKTVIFISHRLASCSLSDRIIVFDDGKIIEDGTHKDLIRSGGVYSTLYKSQLEMYDL